MVSTLNPLYSEFDGNVHLSCFELEMANLVQEIKVVCCRWNLVLRLMQICWIQWWCSISPFWTYYRSFGYNWNIEIGTYTNSTMMNLLVMLICFDLGEKYLFFASLVQKTKPNCLRWDLTCWFWTTNILFWKICFKKSKLSVHNKTSYLD